MMIPRETDLTKKESNTSDNTTKASSSSTTAASWSKLKDPRIVRVSRAFGGKDRHSKVCTVRGLRDRRVRLSVPTAIQLYDLQDRLGFNQPSKVVDWLLNAAKNEIDELPPLQIPPGAFQMMNSHEIRASQSAKHGLNIGDDDRDDSWGRNEGEKQFNLGNQDANVILMNNCVPSYNSFARWDPSNLTLSNPSRSHGLSSNRHEDWHNLSLIPLQSAAAVPSGSHQVLVYQNGISTQPYFPSQIDGSNEEIDRKNLSFQSVQLSHVDSTTQHVRPIHFSMTPNLLPSQNDDGR